MSEEKQSITFGILQPNCILGDPSTNIQHAEDMLASLAGQVHLACLPELFTTGYDLDALGEDIFSLAEEIPGKSTKAFSTMARKMNMGIIVSMVEKDPSVTGWLYISAVVLNRSGDIVGVYRKSHLFPDESSYFRAGNELPVFDIDGVKVGVSICFELAFPQIFTTLALRGAQLIVNPSAVPARSGYLRDVRIRARAQDNQVYVAVVNHVGQEGSIQYRGESQVADPRGDVIGLAPKDEETALAVELPLGLIHTQRRRVPSLRGIRPQLYEPTNNNT